MPSSSSTAHCASRSGSISSEKPDTVHTAGAPLRSVRSRWAGGAAIESLRWRRGVATDRTAPAGRAPRGAATLDPTGHSGDRTRNGDALAMDLRGRRAEDPVLGIVRGDDPEAP